MAQEKVWLMLGSALYSAIDFLCDHEHISLYFFYRIFFRTKLQILPDNICPTKLHSSGTTVIPRAIDLASENFC